MAAYAHCGFNCEWYMFIGLWYFTGFGILADSWSWCVGCRGTILNHIFCQKFRHALSSVYGAALGESKMSEEL